VHAYLVNLLHVYQLNTELRHEEDSELKNVIRLLIIAP